jgi:hypothetical protein
MPVNVSTVKNAFKMHPDLHCGRHRGKGRFSVALDLVRTRRIYCSAFSDFVGVCNEMAKVFGKSEVWICHLTRQPWFRVRVSSLILNGGGVPGVEAFRAEQINSFATLVEIRDDPGAPASARVMCAMAILDRAMGKPGPAN